MSHTIRVFDHLLFLDGPNIFYAERQHVLVVDGIDDRIGVQLLAESLFGRPQVRLTAAYGILSEKWAYP